MDQENWTDAATKVRAAYDLRPSDPVTWHPVARILSQTGETSQAFPWWQKIAQAETISVADRRSYASAALAANELAIASAQIEQLLAQGSQPVPGDLLLTAQLAAVKGSFRSSVNYAERVFSNSKALPPDIFGAALLVFLETAPQSPSYADALARLKLLARGGQSSTSLQALRLMAARPRLPRMTEPEPAPPPIVFPSGSDSTLPPDELAVCIESHPAALPSDRLLAVDLRAQSKPGHTDEYIIKAIASFSHGDDTTLAALGGWLYDKGRFEMMLEILPLARAVLRRDLLLERIDALNALGHFSELDDLVSAENSILDPVLQHVFLAIVRGKLGQTAASGNEWERAVQTAGTVQDFLLVARFGVANGASAIADRAYAEVLTKQPGMRSAYAARLQLAENVGETGKAHSIAARMVQLWPDDSDSQMLELYLRLLLGASDVETKSAEDRAGVFLEHNPSHLGARMVLALARLKLGQQSAALSAVSELKRGEPLNTPPMAVRAAALAANGWKDRAREEAKKLVPATLLPEERSLLIPLLSENQ
jgi:hypothetical protein